MSKNKTELTLEEVKHFLRERWVQEVDVVEQMMEGEESQVFSFEYDENAYVLHINPSIEGFRKDAYAYRQFQSARIPIPRIIQIGFIDEQHGFCVAEKMPGMPLQDVDSPTIKGLLEPTAEVWLALKACDLGQTTAMAILMWRDAEPMRHGRSFSCLCWIPRRIGGIEYFLPRIARCARK